MIPESNIGLAEGVFDLEYFITTFNDYPCHSDCHCQNANLILTRQRPSYLRAKAPLKQPPTKALPQPRARHIPA